MNAPSKLKPRQQRFVDEFVLCGNAAEAARRAGYSEKTARTVASEILTYPDIQEAVRAARAKNAADWDVTRQSVIGGILEAIEMARQMADPAAMLTGYRDLARMCGFNEPEVARVAVVDTSSSALVTKLAAMTDAELAAIAGAGW